MDHEADHTHLVKLKTFRDDFLVLSGITMEQMHEMAERRRAAIKNGTDPRSVESLELTEKVEPIESHTSDVSIEQHQDVADHVKEVSEAVASLQQGQDAMKPAVLWVEGNQAALEALLTGSHAAAEAITEAGAADTASGDKTAQAGSTTAPAAGSEA